MKFGTEKPQKKVVKKTKEKYTPNMLNGKQLLPPEYRDWSRKHNHEGKYGMKTLAWCGLTWDNCRDFLHVECGCGSRFVQEKQGGKIIIT